MPYIVFPEGEEPYQCPNFEGGLTPTEVIAYGLKTRTWYRFKAQHTNNPLWVHISDKEVPSEMRAYVLLNT